MNLGFKNPAGILILSTFFLVGCTSIPPRQCPCERKSAQVNSMSVGKLPSVSEEEQGMSPAPVVPDQAPNQISRPEREWEPNFKSWRH